MVLSEVLDSKMPENDAKASTIREYLHELLLTLWKEGEGFSGKRPFGNSGWQYDITIALVQNGYIEGEVDEEYGDLLSADDEAAYKLVIELINEVFKND